MWPEIRKDKELPSTTTWLRQLVLNSFYSLDNHIMYIKESTINRGNKTLSANHPDAYISSCSMAATTPMQNAICEMSIGNNSIAIIAICYGVSVSTLWRTDRRRMMDATSAQPIDARDKW